VLDDATKRLHIARVAALPALQPSRLGTVPRGDLLATTLRGAHSPLYASPQQIRGEPADVRDDVHALGVIWHQLLTGDLCTGAPTGLWTEELADAGLGRELIRSLGTCVDARADKRPADAARLAELTRVEGRVGVSPAKRWECDEWAVTDSALSNPSSSATRARTGIVSAPTSTCVSGLARRLSDGQWRAVVTGIGWGLVETVINPLTTTLYPEDKTARLNTLHAWWPGGLIAGGLFGIGMGALGAGWQIKLAAVMVPAALVVILCLGVKFPPTERVASGYSMGSMFRELLKPMFLLLFCSMFLTASKRKPGRWCGYGMSCAPVVSP